MRDRLARKGVVLVGHGSRARGFAAPMRRLARELGRGKGAPNVTCAFLEINRPTIGEAVARLARAGVAEVRVVPYFVLMGRHVAADIPQLVDEARRRHPKTKVILCPYLGYHKKILDVVRERLSGCR